MDARLVTRQSQLAMSPMLCRSLAILQLPQLELAALIEEEAAANPLLEVESSHLSSPFLLGGMEPAAKPSLYEHLSSQMRELPRFKQLIAFEIFAHMDERGFLETPLSELSRAIKVPVRQLEGVLRILQSFDPPGIFARDLREAFLIQLQRQGQEKSEAFHLVQSAFDDLLQGRYARLKKKLGISQVSLHGAIRQLGRLSLRPTEWFHEEASIPIYADLVMVNNGSKWIVESKEEALPRLRMANNYLRLPNLSVEEKTSVRIFRSSARWLIRTLARRRELLLSIGTRLAGHFAHSLEGGGPIPPITASVLAAECGVHESTIARAIANKYIEGPNGLLPLKAFVSARANGAAKKLLEEVIAREVFPLTDQQLAVKMGALGVPIARRTIAKYRKQMKIPISASRFTKGLFIKNS